MAEHRLNTEWMDVLVADFMTISHGGQGLGAQGISLLKSYENYRRNLQSTAARLIRQAEGW